jgi:arylsulfatase A-like enzyme
MYENGSLYQLTEMEMAQRPVNMDEMVTDKAIEFISKTHETPYFLYVAYNLVHEPMEYHDEYPVGNNDWPGEEKAFASMLQALDDYVASILAAVDNSGQRESTIIIFTSDNGAHNEGGHDVEFFNSNGIFKEHKRSFYEGGLHAPMIVRWPGVVAPGSQTDLLSAFYDVMPTLCDIAGAPIPDHTDGISFLPTLKGQEQQEHDFLYWEFNESINFKKDQYKQAVRMGDWKGIYYIDEARFELYNLSDDMAEMNNVADAHPDVVQEMKAVMQAQHTPSERFPLLPEERQ